MCQTKTLSLWLLKSSVVYFSLLTLSVTQLFSQKVPQDSVVQRLKSNWKAATDTALKAKAKAKSMSMMGAAGGGAGHPGTAESTLPPVIMPAPNSAVLTRLISENVDLYTGKLNVEIPLYTLKGRQLELPVSLQANVNSHKTNEYGSSVGLGWHLNAGGMITRVMKNLPDEFTGTINATYYNIQGYGYTKIKQSHNVEVSEFESGSYDVTKQREIIDRGNWNVPHDLPAVGYDLQPDEFYFNFGKYSGKFVFDQDGKIHTISKNNLIIDPSYEVRDGNNKIISFIVTTEDGYRYTFGTYPRNAVEETKLTTESKTIRYFYAAVTLDPAGTIPAVDVNTNQYAYYRYPFVFSTISPPGSIAHDNFDNNNNKETKELFFYPSTWHLAYITSPTNEQITLNYADNGTITYLVDRNFASSVINLDEKVYSPGGFNDCFFLTYVEPTRSAPWWPLHYPSPHVFSVTNSTIQLKSKKLQSITSTQGHSITFTSNTNREDFPGDKRLDKITVRNSDNKVLKEFLLDYEIRSSNEALENFKFSYWGTHFYYSAGSYAGYDYSEYFNENKTFDVPAYCRKRMFLKSVQETGGGIQVPPYNFTYDQTGLPFVTSTEQDRYGYANSNPNRHPFAEVNYRYVINGVNRTVPSTSTHPILYFQTTNAGNNAVWPTPGHQGNKYYTLEKLKAGVLTQITYPTGGYKQFDLEYNGNASYWSGLRVKFVKDYSSATATPVTKEYTYGTYQATDGAIIKHEMPENVPIPGYVDTRVFFSSARVNPENLTRGAAGGYDYTEVKQTGNGKYRIEFTNNSMSGFTDLANNTKIISAYLTPNIQDFGAGIVPFPANNNFDWKKGLPLYERYFNEQGTKLKTIKYEYDFTSLNQPTAKTIEGLAVTKARINYQGGGAWNTFLYGKTTQTSSWFTQSAKTEIVYANDGINNVESKEEYTFKKATFNGQDLIFLDQTKLHKPGKNEQLITKYKYPFDYTLTSLSDPWQLALFQFGTSNIKNAVVEKYNYLQNPNGSNKRYISAALNKYKTNDPYIIQTFAYQPSSSLSSFNESSAAGGTFTYDPSYKPVASFTKFLNNGSILEQNEESNAPQAFIWDYNFTYPVAKAVNAAYDDIAYTSFEADNDGSWTVNHVARFNTESVTGRQSYELSLGTITRGNLDPAKTYIFSFWAKPGASVVATGTQTTIQGPQLNQWIYWEKTISGVTSTTISGNGRIDEVRLYPKNAQMTTYTFEPLVGMTSQCDANNRITYYDYDGLQRLVAVRDGERNITKTIQYNYASNSTEPVWMVTNDRRCKPCGQTTYTTNIQQAKYTDINPGSASYGNVDWKDIGDNGACTLQPDWVAISSPTCKLDQNGLRTGILEHIEKDMHPCTPTSNTTRVVQVVNHSVCPPNAPDWQPTAEYRCQPCAGNGAYTNAIQERKYIDMNPNSATYNTVSWQATGGSCVVNADWQFTATAERCAVYNGLPTGFLEREQKDMNPCSPTYNTLRWETTGQSSACNVVYKYLSFENPYYGYQTTVDVVVYLYLDPSYSVPADNVSGQPVTIMDQYSSSCNPMYTFPRYFYVNGPYMTVISGTVYGEWDEGGGCYGYKDYYFGN
jgi:YD repeat-containing protein